MTTVYDVPAEELIRKVAERLKSIDGIKAPEWGDYVTTGGHKERQPTEKDWWHTRVAAILRKVCIKGPIGTERLSGMFGGPKDRGSKPNKAVKGSRSIVRTGLKQLETSKLVSKTESNKGRQVTPEGQKILDNAAHEVKMELAKEDPELMKY